MAPASALTLPEVLSHGLKSINEHPKKHMYVFLSVLDDSWCSLNVVPSRKYIIYT